MSKILIEYEKNQIKLIEFPHKRISIRKSIIGEISISKTKENKLEVAIWYNVGGSCMSQKMTIDNTPEGWEFYEELDREVFK